MGTLGKGKLYEYRGKKKAGAKPRVDRGRILALHNNGWSVAKIADDMGCAQQTVRNALKELTDHDNG